MIDGKLFVHDWGADGLQSIVSTAADNLYENGAPIALVKRGRIDQHAFTHSDTEYTRMLRVLAAAVPSAGRTALPSAEVTRR